MLDGFIRQNGWNMLTIDMNLRVANKSTKGTKRKQEVLVYNYDPEPTLF